MTNNTIFDDVFRTIVEKMTYLIVPLINEVFHTSYPEDVKITLADGTTSACKYWMDMVSCDTAKPLCFYEHPAWNTYAAVTVNEYGKGSTLYLATMFDQNSLEKVLRDYFTSFCSEILAHSDSCDHQGRNQ